MTEPVSVIGVNFQRNACRRKRGIKLLQAEERDGAVVMHHRNAGFFRGDLVEAGEGLTVAIQREQGHPTIVPCFREIGLHSERTRECSQRIIVPAQTLQRASAIVKEIRRL